MTKDEIAAAQNALANALVSNGEAPVGFDQARIEIAKRSLARKHDRDREKRERNSNAHIAHQLAALSRLDKPRSFLTRCTRYFQKLKR